MDAQPQNVVRQHSGWLIPLGFGMAVLVLCGLFLAWYLRPGPRSGAPTGDAAPVVLSVGSLRLSVPANYIAAAAGRAGGAQDMLALSALIPDMRGYSEPEARLFAGNAPDSPVVHLLLRRDAVNLDVAARLARVYMPNISDPHGEPGPFGLTRYGFRPETGYDRADLFAGMGNSGPVLLLCDRALPDLPSPNCLVTANPPARDVSLSYRFKRAWLSQWRQIAGGVDGLVRRFAKS
jgi:hypothetical protein